jgi:hypothetical protein
LVLLYTRKPASFLLRFGEAIPGDDKNRLLLASPTRRSANAHAPWTERNGANIVLDILKTVQ